MSWPEKRIWPLSGIRWPASWLMKVVLPAPFGPITAWVSPERTSRLMPSLARSAPKDFLSSETASSGSVTASLENAGQAALEEKHREHQQRPEVDLPVLGPVRQQVLDQQQREGPEQRPGARSHAAEDHHEHDLARARPVHVVRREEVGVIGEQRAR